MSTLRSYMSNPLIQNYLKVFSVDVLVKASGFILLPLYLALMTEGEFGLYGYLLAIIGSFSLVFNLGMYAAQSKLYHSYEAEDRGAMVFTLNVILAGFLSLLLLLVFLFDLDYPAIALLIRAPIDYASYRPAVWLSVLTSIYSMLLVNFFLTSDNIRSVQRYNLLRALVINAVVLAILWQLAGDHAQMRIGYTALVEFILIVGFSFPYLRAMVIRFDTGMASRALRIGLPIMVSAMLGIVINLSDRYFLEKHGTLETLSSYNLALTLASVVPFAFASFQNVWLPEVLKEKDPARARTRNRRMIIRIAIAWVVLSVGLLLTLVFLLWLGWIRPAYEAALPVLPIALTTALLTAISGMYTNQLIYLEKLSIVVLVGSIVAIMGIFLNQYLVPQWGLMGAAVASLIVNGLFAATYGLLNTYFHTQAVKA